MKKLILERRLQNVFCQGTFGIEREGQRVKKDGTIVKTLHPKRFGKRSYHPYIQTDFAETQLELVSPAKESVDETLRYLKAIHEIVTKELIDDEYIWPLSIPAIFPEEADILEAQISPADTAYRQYLSQKYGKLKQMVSGIHYNFGLHSSFLESFGADYSCNDIYLKLARQFIRYQWVLVYLFGASPLAEKAYFGKEKELEHPVRSIRASQYGYVNEEHIHVPFDSLEHYVEQLEHLISSGELIAEKEFYSSVRFRGANEARELLTKGISYLEFRLFDLNPFCAEGMSVSDARFVHLFLLMLLWIDEEDSAQSIVIGKEKSEQVALSHPLDLPIDKVEGEWLFEQMLDMIEHCHLLSQDKELVLAKKQQLTQPELTVGGRLWAHYQKDKNMAKLGMRLAEQYKAQYLEHIYGISVFENMELSTQALLYDCFRRGLHVDILDENDQFLKLTFNGHIEYVRNGNMTSHDSYISPLIMENKVVTKKVLKDAGFRVPDSFSVRSIDEAELAFSRIQNQPIVIKPKSTNYGLGITIFKEGLQSKLDFMQAVHLALLEDSEVMIEEFIDGTEYRFFVLNGETKAVLLRVPANVTGDGVHTVRELVTMKNDNALRGDGSRTPLKKIQLGEIEQLQLKNQGVSVDTVLPKDITVYLRANSNISTGGDSIDMTDEVHESYKQLAVEITQTMLAKVCGVDLLIPDITVPANADEKTYGIIEANFNPMMMMHIYPSIGKSRALTNDVIDMLFPELVFKEREAV